MKNTPINYIEFKAHDLEKIKQFYQQAFGWVFTDYGPTYVAFSESGLEGGFEKTDEAIVNGVLVVLYHENLPFIKDKVEEAGGVISQEIFLSLVAKDFTLGILREMNWRFGLIGKNNSSANRISILVS